MRNDFIARRRLKTRLETSFIMSSMTNDLAFIFIWWVVYFFVGIASLPLAFILFRSFLDKGYGVAKTLGFLVITYLAFILGIAKLLPFTRVTLVLILAVYFLVNLLLFLKNKNEFLKEILRAKRLIFFQEIFFTFGYLLWVTVRSYQPDINGLEKFMDFGFINSLLRSAYFPPLDMWLAGSSINYYWFGHLWAALATKLTGIPSDITYNLMLATILGLGLTSAFSLSGTLISRLAPYKKRLAYFGGVISAIVLVFGGNFHTPFYVLKDGASKYWYPDATRFIGYNPETEDKTIHEFPMYSFVVSDLHAHLLNLPFVLLYIALLWAWVIGQERTNLKRASLGFLLGVMFMTSTWDFGNYLLTTGVVFLFLHFRKYKFSIDTLFETGKNVLVIVLIAGLTCLPFILNFESIAEGIDFVKARTPIWQLLILWGFPLVLTLVFLFGVFGKKLKRTDVFVLGLLASAWILIFIPEIIYVKDIYIASHHRANTMFKLTYQAFVMSYLVSGYIVMRFISNFKVKFFKFLAVIFFTSVFAGVLIYPYFSVRGYYGNLKNYKGLSGETWLKATYPDEYGAVLWFRENVEGQSTILEAQGDSYTENNVVSSYTGLPTVLGWYVHEWLWRGTPEIPQKRSEEVNRIYTSDNPDEVKNLLARYKVEYVIFGKMEREKYPTARESTFEMLGQKVFSQGALTIYKIGS